VQLTPLYHAVALTRELALGMPALTTIGHAGYLVALGIAGTLVAARRLERTLLT
jgi:lipooligosaccharide transport system permease protein